METKARAFQFILNIDDYFDFVSYLKSLKSLKYFISSLDSSDYCHIYVRFSNMIKLSKKHLNGIYVVNTEESPKQNIAQIKQYEVIDEFDKSNQDTSLEKNEVQTALSVHPLDEFPNSHQQAEAVNQNDLERQIDEKALNVQKEPRTELENQKQIEFDKSHQQAEQSSELALAHQAEPSESEEPKWTANELLNSRHSADIHYSANELLYIKEKNIKPNPNHDFSKDPEYQQWYKDLTNGVLDEFFSFASLPENQKALEYLNERPINKLIDDKSHILLFEPLNWDRFNELCKTNTYKPNEPREFIDSIISNYYLNNITNFNVIMDYIDSIYHKEVKPFKISFDCGFIIEDSVEETYEYTTPHVDNLGNKIPMIIKTPSDVDLFKHFVYTNISDYVSVDNIKKGSRFHYVSIHSILFQVTKLQTSGGGILPPGYEFLKSCKYIKDYGNKNNLCMFNCVANAKKDLKNDHA